MLLAKSCITITAFWISLSAGAALPDRYVQWPAQAKQTYIYGQVQSSEYQQLKRYSSLGCRHLLKSVSALMNLRPTVLRTSDEMPEGRVKAIHTFGSVAPVVFEPAADSPYTGIFSGETAYGIARISLAVPPKLGFIPGMALKFFVDGKPSVNLLVMNSITAQKDPNIFSKTFSNVVPGPVGVVQKLLSFRFSSVVEDPTRISLVRAAELRTDGTVEEAPEVPERIYLVPTPEAAQYTPADSKADFRSQLKSIPVGTKLYDVYGETAGRQVRIGTLTTLGAFLASAYGDERLFFHHPSDSLKVP